MVEDVKQEYATNGSHPRWRLPVLLVSLGIVCLIAGVFLLFQIKASYHERVWPGITVGSVGVGGMNKDELRKFFDSMSQKLGSEGVQVSVARVAGAGESFTIYPVVAAGSDTLVLFDIDAEKEAKRLLTYNRGGGSWREFVAFVRTWIQRPSLALEHIRIDRTRLRDALMEKVDKERVVPTNAGIQIDTFEPLTYHVTVAAEGTVFEYVEAIEAMEAGWRHLLVPAVTLREVFIRPSISEQDVNQILPSLPDVVALGALRIDGPPVTATTSATVTSTFHGRIQLSTWSRWLVPVRDGDTVRWGIEANAATAFLEQSVAPFIDIEANDARFKIDARGKVSEFQAPAVGVSLDRTASVRLLDDTVAKKARGEDIPPSLLLPTTVVEPLATMANVNELGITELLGTGVSNFAGSPKNRILNIRNAVKKLHGLLIKPDEEFSTIKYTLPYTLEGGYVPELVIKGTSLKPELGGGLCQVGSTLFRMAMNSGMPITERRNHSLAVSYYNDPASGLPGVDATIYEPAPDFKFLNDTGNYVLIQAEMNEKTGTLSLSLWGTSDGRKGSYGRPVVSKWYPAGETQTIETDTMMEGEKKCQHAFRGASASFTYTRTLADGTSEDRVFESYYRPLPEICMVGTKKPDTPAPEGEVPVPVPEGTSEAVPVVQ